ncbi:MAG: flagellar hook-basal body complex protein FliE [Planctomycetota bacterium]|nr:flagellar hook-basal body complex protein FliE [Planctomycetota bacterium]MCX8040154.1 flagellar hook-basal body complex protein FliE [Planctomycetota bacterium]MDW8372551.1 flagellar hook-basal body complex protein FliE [Planctomycetota bacterium]
MPQPLDPLRALYGSQPTPPPAPAASEAARDADGRTFQDVLSDFVKQVDQSQREYDQAIRAVERGDVDNLHRVMLAQSQAQLSLRLAVEVRNKLVEAYKELNRTQF